MTETEALELLKHHSYSHEDTGHTKTGRGFLGMLRPFDGHLYEDNFHELMAVLQILKERFKRESIDRQIISSVWSICHLAKAWGLDEEGMLQRNHLLTDKQTRQLTVWVDCISYAVMSLLEGMDDEYAFEPYRLYIEDNQE